MSIKRHILFFSVAGFIFLNLSTPFASTPNKAEEGTRLLESAQNVFIDLAKRVTPSVVNISPVSHTGSASPHGGRDKEEPDTPSGSGSGVIIDKDGYIVTNSHVVHNAKEVQVRLSDKTEFVGKVIGEDPDTDLAVVKIDTDTALPSVALGDSKTVEVGQWVMAVGNPFGLDRTVTIGVVSGLGRENIHLSRYENFIQTDASINPGNSGGPLFNIYGEVVGINTAIINVAQGIGFAIPSDMVQTIARQLMAQGKVTRGWLGVGIQQLTPALAKKFNVKEESGVLVNEVFEGDPASKGGVQTGDIILKVGGKEVSTTGTLARVIAGFMPGEEIEIELIRSGQTQTLKMALAEKKEGATTASLPPSERFFGLKVENITPENLEKFKLKDEKEGVVITEVESQSPADEEGLKPGDVITEMEGEKIKTIEDFKRAAKKAEASKTVLLRTTREDRSIYIVLENKGE